jgi:hypothetical protein
MIHVSMTIINILLGHMIKVWQMLISVLDALIKRQI